VVVSAIEAVLTEAHIPYLVTDRNMSVLVGSIEPFPCRIIVGDCCVSDARRLLVTRAIISLQACSAASSPLRVER
jgi:Putative prokaryotic signal transducing protein